MTKDKLKSLKPFETGESESLLAFKSMQLSWLIFLGKSWTNSFPSFVWSKQMVWRLWERKIMDRTKLPAKKCWNFIQHCNKSNIRQNLNVLFVQCITPSKVFRAWAEVIEWWHWARKESTLRRKWLATLLRSDTPLAKNNSKHSRNYSEVRCRSNTFPYHDFQNFNPGYWYLKFPSQVV